MYSRGVAFIAMLFGTCTADKMWVHTTCPIFGSCDSSRALFYTDYGVYLVNANEGCRGTNVPGMIDFCMDWGNQRGHFQFSHQDFKRCLRHASSDDYSCSDGMWVVRCSDTWWDEVPCTWKVAPPSQNQNETEKATVSATLAPESVVTDTL
jgi:hypothetical protein